MSLPVLRNMIPRMSAVPIVTKPDMIDKGTLSELIDMILNNRKKMQLGYLLMCNTGYANKDLSWEEARQAENEFFHSDHEWSKVPKASKELPLLKKEVICKIEQLQHDLKGMGSQIASLHEARVKFVDLTMRLQPSLNGFLSGTYTQEYMDKFKDQVDDLDEEGSESPRENIWFIRSSLQKMYKAYNQAMKESDGQTFETSETVEKVANGTLTSWKMVTKEHVYKMHQYLHEAVKLFLMYSFENVAVREVFLDIFLTFYRSQVKLINEAVDNIFADESTPITLNSYYYDTILKVAPRKRKQTLTVYRDIKTQKAMHSFTLLFLKVPFMDVKDNEEKAAEDMGEQLYCGTQTNRRCGVDADT
ncbi:hypothetical protein BG004_006624 [Podila humilis]|nr:hypothetical protein BG004_006624 [Podila humilis]